MYRGSIKEVVNVCTATWTMQVCGVDSVTLIYFNRVISIEKNREEIKYIIN